MFIYSTRDKKKKKKLEKDWCVGTFPPPYQLGFGHSRVALNVIYLNN